MNAILHIERMGAQWDSLPRELPLRSNADEDFKRWSEDGARQLRWNVLRRAAIWRTARNPIPASTARRSEPPNKGGRVQRGQKNHWPKAEHRSGLPGISAGRGRDEHAGGGRGSVFRIPERTPPFPPLHSHPKEGAKTISGPSRNPFAETAQQTPIILKGPHSPADDSNTTTSAWSASPRPTGPTPSPDFAFTLTRSAAMPKISATRDAISRLCGPSFGRSA
jgi:hypothetical protein